MKLVDAIFTELPFYGSRKMVYEIRRRKGWTVNRKRVSLTQNTGNIPTCCEGSVFAG